MSVARLTLAAVLITAVPGCRTRGGTTAGLVSAVSWSAAATVYTRADPDHRDDREVVAPAAILLTVAAYALLAAVIFESQPRSDESGATSYGNEAAGSHGADGAGGTSSEPASRGHGHGPPGAVDLSCSFGNCGTHGSSGRTPSGATVDTRCSFGDCDKHGWSTTVDGVTSESRCSFGECNKHGWSTTNGDGTSSDTRCSFGACDQHGWTTTTPEGTFESRCSFGDCNKHGWTTTGSDGSSVDCRCKFGDCDAHGVECH